METASTALTTGGAGADEVASIFSSLGKALENADTRAALAKLIKNLHKLKGNNWPEVGMGLKRPTMLPGASRPHRASKNALRITSFNSADNWIMAPD
jgi:hypothetical protein